jgi:hypothetical protein
MKYIELFQINILENNQTEEFKFIEKARDKLLLSIKNIYNNKNDFNFDNKSYAVNIDYLTKDPYKHLLSTENQLEVISKKCWKESQKKTKKILSGFYKKGYNESLPILSSTNQILDFNAAKDILNLFFEKLNSIQDNDFSKKRYRKILQTINLLKNKKKDPDILSLLFSTLFSYDGCSDGLLGALDTIERMLLSEKENINSGVIENRSLSFYVTPWLLNFKLNCIMKGIDRNNRNETDKESVERHLYRSILVQKMIDICLENKKMTHYEYAREQEKNSNSNLKEILVHIFEKWTVANLVKEVQKKVEFFFWFSSAQFRLTELDEKFDKKQRYFEENKGSESLFKILIGVDRHFHCVFEFFSGFDFYDAYSGEAIDKNNLENNFIEQDINIIEKPIKVLLNTVGALKILEKLSYIHNKKNLNLQKGADLIKVSTKRKKIKL